jgi:hypothetical protein
LFIGNESTIYERKEGKILLQKGLRIIEFVRISILSYLGIVVYLIDAVF